MRLQNTSGDGSIFISGAGGSWQARVLAGHNQRPPGVLDCRRLPESAGPGAADQSESGPREASSGLSLCEMHPET